VRAASHAAGEDLPEIAARKYAVVFRPQLAAPAGVAMKLRSNQFRVAETHGPADTLAAIGRMPWLSLLVAEGPVDAPAYQAVVQTVRRDHPELPILRVRSSEDDLAAGDEVPVVDRAELLDRAERLLVQRAYPASMLAAVPRAAIDTLREAFNTDAELLSVSLKLTRHMLGRVVPLLPLGGRGISGHLVLNVVSPQLRRIHRSSFPSATRVSTRELGDLGGELLNQTAGRLKGALRAAVAIELGLPMVITGENLTLRVTSPAPTVLFDFAAFGRHLFLEFALAATEEAAAAPHIADVEQLAAGELSLF
jgi:hypothetical protein